MEFLNFISSASIPVILLLIITYGFFKKQNIYEHFLAGATEGLSTVIKILPSLLGLTIAITVFRESGALDYIINFISPFLELIGVPREVVPLILIRPISGSGALASLSDIMTQYGVDSLIGKLACVIMGSTETVLYTLTIYFGCIGIKKTKYTLYPALIADIIGVFTALFLFRFFN